MPVALFFRPNTDLALTYGSSWLADGIKEATRRGYKVIDLVDEECTFENLKQVMETQKIDVAIMLGHGSSSLFSGSEMQIVFRACTGDEIMSGTMSHFLSCSVGQELLPSIIKKKGVWTTGYAVDFQFMIEPAEAVEPFRDITVAIIMKILDGGKLKEVWDAGIVKGEEWKERLWDRPEMWCAEAIQLIDHDIHGLIGLGDKEAYVMPPRMVVAANLVPILGLAVVGYFLFSKR